MAGHVSPIGHVSVIIPVYDRAPYARQCVDIGFAQTCPDVEVAMPRSSRVFGESA